MDRHWSPDQGLETLAVVDRSSKWRRDTDVQKQWRTYCSPIFTFELQLSSCPSAVRDEKTLSTLKTSGWSSGQQYLQVWADFSVWSSSSDTFTNLEDNSYLCSFGLWPPCNCHVRHQPTECTSWGTEDTEVRNAGQDDVEAENDFRKSQFHWHFFFKFNSWFV